MLLVSHANAQTAPPTPAVTVETVSNAPFVRTERYTAELASPNKVDVTARVEGVLGPRRAEDGASITKGDILYTIDDAPYQAHLARAKAELASAKAAEVLAKEVLDRSRILLQRDTVAQATVDTNQAEFNEAVAAAAVAQADVAIAELNLEYTTIIAPLTGRIGTQLFSEGALVNEDSGALVTIYEIDPMRVHFSVPQRQFLRARTAMTATGAAPTINVVLSDGSLYGSTAELLFVDPRAETTTDSVRLVAQVPNPDGHLLDGQLVTVSVDRTETAATITVPQTALLRDTEGPYAFVVDQNDTVAQARLELGERSGQRVAVNAGLSVGDKVIVVGQSRVRPGMKVTTDEAVRPGAGTTNTTTRPPAPAEAGHPPGTNAAAAPVNGPAGQSASQ